MPRRWRVGLPLLLVVVLGLAEVAGARPPAARPTGSKWRGATAGSRQRNRILRRPVQVPIGAPRDVPRLEAAQRTRALARIRAARPDAPQAQLESGFDRYRAVTRRVRGAARGRPGSLRVSRAGRAAGLSILRVDLLGDQPVRGRRPRVLIVGGLHAGNETVGVEAATRFIEAAAGDADLRNQFDITVVPLANPTALVLGTRENADQVDANRTFADGRWTAESLAIRAIAEEAGGDFDLVVDLHGAGSRGRNGFFLIRAGEDGGMSSRVLSAMESGALMDPKGGRIGPYRFDQLGGAVSVNPGTLTGWFARRGTRHSYTLEAPLRLRPDRQVRGMLKMLRSTLFNVRRHGD